jgi:hypothetical protein
MMRWIVERPTLYSLASGEGHLALEQRAYPTLAPFTTDGRYFST